MHPLLDVDFVQTPPEAYLASVGTVFATFGRNTQDSGNASFGVRIGDERFFVKTAGAAADPSTALTHPERVALLRNAVRLARSCRHPALPALGHVVEAPGGPWLVYEWLQGELLGVPRGQRENPASAFQRFRRLPAETVAAHVGTICDLHARLAAAGWVASDFYDGCLLYDFEAGRLHVIDLDNYHQGPFTNRMGRMFGSSRFMAPEEFELGARIDQRTTVYGLGRAALVLLSDGSLNPAAFRGSRAQFDVAARACQPNRTERYGSAAEFYAAWQRCDRRSTTRDGRAATCTS